MEQAREVCAAVVVLMDFFKEKMVDVGYLVRHGQYDAALDLAGRLLASVENTASTYPEQAREAVLQGLEVSKKQLQELI